MGKKQITTRKPVVQMKWADLIILVLFIVIALAYSTGHVGNHLRDYISLNSDAANISSFSAALDHPDFFLKDPLLKDPKNFAFYYTVHVPIIRFLGQRMGNYGSAFALLLFPVTLLHLIGYFILGNAFIKNRTLSLLFSLTAMIPVSLNLGESWGLMNDAIPRFLFQALLPFVLALVIKFGKQVRRWPWLMALTGLLVYAHPVSFPAWALAILFSLWVLVNRPWKKKIVSMLLAGLILGLIVLPFVLNYLSSTEFGSRDVENYNYILNIMSRRFIQGFVDLRVGFTGFIETAITSHWVNILLWGALLAIALMSALRFRQIKDDHNILVLIAWWSGILLISVVAPIIDHAGAALLKRFPLEVDLIRGLRYTIPLTLLSIYYFLAKLSERHFRFFRSNEISIKPIYISIIGFMIFTGWALRYQLPENAALTQSVKCWGQGRLTCDVPDEELLDQRIEILNTIRVSTPQNAGILGTNFSDIAVRFYSQRSLVYSYKDGASFIYANHSQLMQWYEQFEQMNEIEKVKNDLVRYLDGLVGFARHYHADYLLLRNEEIGTGNYLPDGVERIFHNPSYDLLKIAETQE